MTALGSACIRITIGSSAIESPTEPFSISLKIACRPLPGQLCKGCYFEPPLEEPVPPAPDDPLELDEEPGMALPDFEDPDEPVEPVAPLEPEVPEAPEEPDVAPPPSRWPQPVVTNMALNKAIASIDLEDFDIAFIFIPFRNIEVLELPR